MERVPQDLRLGASLPGEQLLEQAPDLGHDGSEQGGGRSKWHEAVGTRGLGVSNGGGLLLLASLAHGEQGTTLHSSLRVFSWVLANTGT